MRKLLLCLLAILPAIRDHAQQCPTIINCPQGTQQFCDYTDNDPAYWNEAPYTWSPTLQNADVYEGSADLQLTVLGCSGGGPMSVTYVLYFDFDNDHLEETIVMSTALPPTGRVLCNNAFNPGYTGGDTLLFDEHTLIDSLRFGFGLETSSNGDTTFARVGWNTTSNPNSFITPRLPEGKHRIVWTIVQDGQLRTCERAFRVKDCFVPLLECQSLLSVTLDTSGAGSLVVDEVLFTMEDNVTPLNLLELAIRRANTGLGFPVDAGGNAIQSVQFNCDDVGLQPVELWVRDRAGNINFCISEIAIVGDEISCPIPYPNVCVTTYWGNGHPIKQVAFDMAWVLPNQPVFTYPLPVYSDACAVLDSLPPAEAFTIIPKKNIDPLNGISTYDLVLMSRHILAVQLFDAPWKIVAADINKNGSVTTTDIIELRKLLLGVTNVFPNNTSWRFFVGDCQFPANPFTNLCLSTLTLQTLPFHMYQPHFTFKGLKVGDVNGSADPESIMATPDVRSALSLLIPDKSLQKGDIIDIPVRVSEMANWSGFQLALQFDERQLILENILPGSLPAMDEHSFARPAQGLLTASWFDAVPHWLAPGDCLFTLRMKAIADVQLRNALQLNAARLSPEAYGVGEESRPLELAFDRAENSASETMVFSPQPNPSSGAIRIPLRLTQAETVHIELSDLSGKQIYVFNQTVAPGTTMLEIPATAFTHSGTYLWRVRAGAASGSGKLIRI